MNAQDIHNLQEAYMEVVGNQQLDEGMTMKDFMTARKNRERREKRNELSPTRRVGIHTPEKKPERDARRDAAYGETGHGGALRPKKVRKAKALGELGEQADLYDIILSHLLDEGYAQTPEAAEAIMVNMSEDWREDIVEGYKERPVEKMKKKAMKIVDDPEYDGEPESVWRHQQILKHATRSAKSREAAKRKSQKNVDKYWEKEDR